MIKNITLSAIAAASLALGFTGAAQAAGDAGHIEDVDFSFEGPFGSFDQLQLQRGLQVFTESCAACHGMKFVPIRTLSDKNGPGMPEDQVRAYAAIFPILDETANLHLIDIEKNEYRPLTQADNFPANNTANAPDLSLMAKARAGFHGPQGTGINQILKGMGGPEYIYSILTGYTGKEKVEAGTTFYENTAFPGGWIAMAPPLFDGQFEFADGHSSDPHHVAEDISAFLMWTAEPTMMARKKAGLVGVIFLSLFTFLLYLTNKKLWAPHKGKKLSA